MLNLLRPLVLLSPMLLLTTIAATVFASPAHADDDEIALPIDPLYPCGVVYRSGHWVVNSAGEMVNLDEICTQRQAAQRAVQVVETDGDAFLQAFYDVASTEAIAFANSAGTTSVIEYGSTICPLLQTGNTMADIRRTQVRNGLPASFDGAVNVAAINTYCPGYQSEIGR